ncbi:MAG TPA: ABC transporter ATP-binding protein [Rhodocyclaceae bacterium]|nr:ABC transporter ATP-binding protein [Rhodocyclaceae bacterium]
MSLCAQALKVTIGKTVVANELHLQLLPGDCLAVLGRNGVGKTTLLSVLAGLRSPDAGCITLHGRDLSDWPPRELARQRAWLPQMLDDAFPASVLETVLVGRHPWLSRFTSEGEADIAIAYSALAEAGLSDYAQRNVQMLSGGERQRVAIASMLTQAAKLLLLDEPLTHLDPGRQIATLKTVATLASNGGTVVMVLHDLNLALRHCNRFLLLLGDGQYVLTDANGMHDTALVERLWGHAVRRLDDDGRPHFIAV